MFCSTTTMWAAIETSTRWLSCSKFEGVNYQGWTMTIIFTAILGILMFTGATQPALACRCVPMSTAKAYRIADVVVRASVVTVEGGARARLRVEEAWKADVAGEVDVSTASTAGTDCASDFQLGREYLIYLHRARDTGELTTEICMGNRLTTEADTALNWMSRHGQKSKLVDGRSPKAVPSKPSGN